MAVLGAFRSRTGLEEMEPAVFIQPVQRTQSMPLSHDALNQAVAFEVLCRFCQNNAIDILLSGRSFIRSTFFFSQGLRPRMSLAAD